MTKIPRAINENAYFRQRLEDTRTEAQIQSALIEWWTKVHRSLGVRDARQLIMIPNGSYFGGGVKTLRSGKTVPLGAIRFAALKRQGFVQGAPDLFLAARGVVVVGPSSVRVYAGLFIEMKRAKGGVVSPEQRELHAVLEAAGYVVVVARGFDAAVEAITNYLRSNLTVT